MNEEVLSQFNRATDACAQEYRVNFGQKMRTIDTSEKSQDEVSYQVTKDILETLDRSIVENIAYFDREVINGLKEEVFDSERIFGSLRQFSYRIRSDVESDGRSVQPIPVAVITDTAVSKIVVARKRRAATSSLSPERNRDLIYFGGHVREEDESSEFGSESIIDVVAAALARELKEELDIDYDASADKPMFCIWNRDNERSAKHVALVYHVKVDRQSLRVVTDRNEFSERGARVVSLEKLRARAPNFELWSSIIFEEIGKRASALR
jgi:predicted NUDIX family phosphoesterase